MAARFCASPAGRLATKVTASCGECCTMPEATTDKNELRPSPSGSRLAHSIAALGSDFAHSKPRRVKACCWSAPSGNCCTYEAAPAKSFGAHVARMLMSVELRISPAGKLVRQAAACFGSVFAHTEATLPRTEVLLYPFGSELA